MYLLKLVIFYLLFTPISYVQASFIDTEAETAVIIDATTVKGQSQPIVIHSKNNTKKMAAVILRINLQYLKKRQLKRKSV